MKFFIKHIFLFRFCFLVFISFFASILFAPAAHSQLGEIRALPQEQYEEIKLLEAELAGECLCSIDDKYAPLTPMSGMSIASCFDRNANTGDGRGDATGRDLYNCRWIPKEEVEETMDKNQNELKALDAKIQRERNPLEGYKSSLGKLNKLRATSVQGFFGGAIKTATGIMGTIALAMMIYGGFLWLTSMGNSSQVEKAQNVIFWGVLGIFVIFGSYALVSFIFEAISPVNTTNPTP